jgi:predicted ATPase
MYINDIKLQNFRTFQDERVTFVHPDQNFKKLGIPKPKLSNINLLLGNNGSGKSALLKAISLVALGPAVSDSGIFPYRLVRRTPVINKAAKSSKADFVENTAILEATFTPHEQDDVPKRVKTVESKVQISQIEDLERLIWIHGDDKSWHPVFSASSDAFFMVGYGATRRTETQKSVDFSSRNSNAFARAQRVRGLFEDSYSLIPLESWLPQYKNKGRYSQVVKLINRLLGEGSFTFAGEMEKGDFLFKRNGFKIPFPAMSDGYRAFLGWVGDLLYHVCQTCPPGKRLDENKGIIMIDEIDLHLHPKWQMTILPTLAQHLPQIQFIVTSHSPLIVGSLEWMNIIYMSPELEQSASKPVRLETSVNGLDADQVLLTDFFGLTSTRAESKKSALKDLSLRASEGNLEAARELLTQMTKGMETVK